MLEYHVIKKGTHISMIHTTAHSVVARHEWRGFRTVRTTLHLKQGQIHADRGSWRVQFTVIICRWSARTWKVDSTRKHYGHHNILHIMCYVEKKRQTMLANLLWYRNKYLASADQPTSSDGSGSACSWNELPQYYSTGKQHSYPLR